MSYPDSIDLAFEEMRIRAKHGSSRAQDQRDRAGLQAIDFTPEQFLRYQVRVEGISRRLDEVVTRLNNA